jgi:hypothetical protein
MMFFGLSAASIPNLTSAEVTGEPSDHTVPRRR